MYTPLTAGQSWAEARARTWKISILIKPGMTKNDTFFRLKAVGRGRHRLNVRLKAGGKGVPVLNPDRKHFTPWFMVSEELAALPLRELRYL
jgi:hypothetical protein